MSRSEAIISTSPVTKLSLDVPTGLSLTTPFENITNSFLQVSAKENISLDSGL